MSADPYLDYLSRFQSSVGAVAVGSYGKWKGRLVRKLAPDEFAHAYEEFTTLNGHYRKIVERGDTLNDALTKLLREKQGDLLLED